MCGENRLETCSVYSIDSLNNSSIKINGLFLASFNVRSINKNFDDFPSYISNLYTIPDVIILTETRFSQGITITDNIAGYITFNSTRSEKSGDGVTVFLKIILDCCITEIIKASLKSIESVHIKFHASRSKNINIIAVYRPPYYHHLI